MSKLYVRSIYKLLNVGHMQDANVTLTHMWRCHTLTYLTLAVPRLGVGGGRGRPGYSKADPLDLTLIGTAETAEDPERVAFVLFSHPPNVKCWKRDTLTQIKNIVLTENLFSCVLLGMCVLRSFDDVTWRDVAWRDVTWRDATWLDVTHLAWNGIPNRNTTRGSSFLRVISGGKISNESVSIWKHPGNSPQFAVVRL